MSIFYKNREYCLNTFRGLNFLADDDRENFVKEMQKRIRRIVDDIYIDPDALCQLEEHVPYSLNIDEFWHHMLPFVNKIFVVFLTNLITGHQKLLYAANICVPNQSTCKKFMTDYDEVAYIMEYQMPPVVYDATHLIAKFNAENDAFCVDTIDCILSAQFTRESYKTDLTGIRTRCRSGNYETLLLMWSFCRETKNMLKRVFSMNIQNSSFNAQHLKNDKLEAYGRGAMRQMPLLEQDLCADAGLVYFLSYEVAMELKHL